MTRTSGVYLTITTYVLKKENRMESFKLPGGHVHMPPGMIGS